MRRWLKPLRVLLAVVFFGVLSAAFLDFRGLMPTRLAHAFAAMQLGPATLAAVAGSALAAGSVALLLIVTLLFGRVYCSVICPLGILQDAIARLRPRRRTATRFAPENKTIRYGFLTSALLAVALGATGVAFTLLDPYSHFGRITATLGRTALVIGNNTLVPAAQTLGWQALYRVPPPAPPLGLVLFATIAAVTVAALALWRGRIYCNTVCPVGTILGLLSRVSAFRLTIDPAACTKCADCLRACKAQCIDLRAGRVDASRCVACANCLSACRHGGIAYRFAWRRTQRAPDPQRRALVAGALAVPPLAALQAVAAAPRRAPVAPPGAHSATRLLDRCTGCQLCVTACPTQVLQPAVFDYGWLGFAKPHLDFERAFCNFDCHRCGDVCPTGAILPLALADKRLTSVGTAQFERSRCIVETDGTDCAACSEHCPTKAVNTVPFRDNLRLPAVNESLCIGCGACEFACPVRPQRAITVTARATHTRAAQAVEARPQLPKPTGDFPF
ncbi:MAG: 4Fe-4S binding protein [Candidatus Didemnitutus sp.]|nr:4Fe-4S binding protein [Candidatus Didemnitutus sp.]